MARTGWEGWTGRRGPDHQGKDLHVILKARGAPGTIFWGDLREEGLLCQMMDARWRSGIGRPAERRLFPSALLSAMLPEKYLECSFQNQGSKGGMRCKLISRDPTGEGETWQSGMPGVDKAPAKSCQVCVSVSPVPSTSCHLEKIDQTPGVSWLHPAPSKSQINY